MHTSNAPASFCLVHADSIKQRLVSYCLTTCMYYALVATGAEWCNRWVGAAGGVQPLCRQGQAPAAHLAMLVTSSDSCAATRGDGSANSSSSARARTAPRSASGRRAYVRVATVLRQLLPTAFFATTAASRRTACASPDALVAYERAFQPMLYPLIPGYYSEPVHSACLGAELQSAGREEQVDHRPNAARRSLRSLLAIRSSHIAHTTKVAQGHLQYCIMHTNAHRLLNTSDVVFKANAVL